MMKPLDRSVVAVGLLGMLLTAGCQGSTGGGTSSLFEGGTNPNEELAPSDNASMTLVSAGPSTEPGVTDIATLHNPEPASLALFGGGLLGLAVLRRQRAKPRA